ncbi:phosphorylase kinase gamma isoform X1 [Haematobia irritans]|uniref:phosphorylase kinase gamma isoform X1 n=1 Tax=Haematobia irritans TaxID=7368 RepID=UPI003F50035C
MAKDEEDDLLPDKDAAKGFYAKYEPKEILGRGISSTVRRCIEKETGKEFAAKIIDLGAGTESGDTNPHHMLEATRQEISILRQVMGHPYIIDLQDVFESDAFVFLVFELCPKGELFDYLTSVVTLSEKKTRTIMRQIFEGVEYIHAKNIVHRDLKPENILLDENHNVKITDFGFARQLKDGEKLTDLCGTPGYLAPETLKCNMFEGSPGYGQEVDIWACGVIMFTLLVGCPPFWHRKQMVMLRNIMEGKYSFTSPEWADISEDPKDLIRKCLVVDPAQRIKVHEVLQHPFFNQMVLLPEPSFDGQKTTYHLREQSIHAIRQYSKFYQTNSTNTNLLNSNNYHPGQPSYPTGNMQQREKQIIFSQNNNTSNNTNNNLYGCQNHSGYMDYCQNSTQIPAPDPLSQQQLQHQTSAYHQLSSQLHKCPSHQDFFYTPQLRKQSRFNARKKFQFAILVIRAVIRIRRLRYTAEPLHVEEAIRDPYRVKVLRKVIDGCAFRVYGHWVKKGEGQNRAALFENTPRTELHALYINNLSR